MAIVLLDASVVIALLDGDDPHHTSSVEALRTYAAHDLRIPASAYAESLVGPERHGQGSEAAREIRQLVDAVEPLTPEMAERAAYLRAATGSLTLGDALVLATADVLSADLVLTADQAWKGLLASVVVIG